MLDVFADFSIGPHSISFSCMLPSRPCLGIDRGKAATWREGRLIGVTDDFTLKLGWARIYVSKPNYKPWYHECPLVEIGTGDSWVEARMIELEPK